MAQVIDNLNIEDKTTLRQLVMNLTTIVISSVTTTLDSTSSSHIIFTGIVGNQVIKLTDATTLPLGFKYLFVNTSSQNITIQDNGSNNLFILYPGTNLELALLVNGTPEGTWGSINAKVDPFVPQDITSAGTIVYTGQSHLFINVPGGGNIILPDVTLVNRPLCIIKTGGSNISLVPGVVGQTINGSSSLTIQNNNSVTLAPRGGKWWRT